MNADLSSIPQPDRKEILEILALIQQEFKPEKVIVFGSQIGNSDTLEEYLDYGFSDRKTYDFLVVMYRREERLSAFRHRINEEINSKRHLKGQFNFLIHDHDEINQSIGLGQSFFTDILDKGILLFDAMNIQFQKRNQHINPTQEREKAQAHFDLWYPQGHAFLKGAVFHLSDKEHRVAAQSLHQAAECFYIATLLVFTGYAPRTRNLSRLRSYAKHLSVELYHTLNSREGSPLHNFLEQGYKNARTKLEYTTTAEELRIVTEKIINLQGIVGLLCKEKMDELGN